MKVEVVDIDQDSGEYTLEYDDEVLLACEYYAKDRDERLKAYEAITTMTEYWEEPS